MPTTMPNTAIPTIGRDKRPEGPLSVERRIRRAMKCARPKVAAGWLVGRAKIACMALALGGCARPGTGQPIHAREEAPPVITGAERAAEYLPLLAGKRVAVVTNQTGRIGEVHLVDSLLASGVTVTKVFAPEHGFRGEADAGEHVKDQRDVRTGLPVVSLYGTNKKPTAAQLADVDVLVFDIQDVGVRFYTYIGTLHYVMEAAADHGKQLVVLDRPNPNGHYVDGPVLDMRYRSFVGMHPVPLVHGMTVAEFARMIDGEGWLKDGLRCAPIVVPCLNYYHGRGHVLPVRPSPNLPDMQAVYLYPSLGLFEGTVVSVGRGTDRPFKLIGYPGNPVGDVRFTPVPMPGAKDPPHKGRECVGSDLSEEDVASLQRIRLDWLVRMYRGAPDRKSFFLANGFFDKLAGGPGLRESIEQGLDEDIIRQGWEEDLSVFRGLRAKYLLYEDHSRGPGTPR